MFSDAEEHVIYQIANARVHSYPYPHFYVDSVFPDNFYRALRYNWPDSTSLVSLPDTGRVPAGAYTERYVLPFKPHKIARLPADRREFWTAFGSWFLGERFLRVLLEKFDDAIYHRFGAEAVHCSYDIDALIVRDHTDYQIGPHTDAPHRLLSLLFYCPDDDSRRHLGTSIYVPIDPDFRCQGGPHYPHHKFRRVRTMEYRPNSLFGFFKTDNSFHGVEPIADPGVLRDVLLYDIRVEAPPPRERPAASRPGAGFSAKMLRRLLGGRS
jgi:hypothetical protein